MKSVRSGAPRRSVRPPHGCRGEVPDPTGQRTLEVLEMASGEIDADEKTWTIPAGRRKSRWKQRYDHVIPLEQLHLDLIERARSMGDGGQLTFAGLTEGEPMTPEYIGDALARFAKQAGIPHFTPRDLRRTWKTLAGRYGIDLQLRNRIQGHALTDVGSRHYDRHDYLEEKRVAMARFCKLFSQELAGKPKLAPIRKPDEHAAA